MHVLVTAPSCAAERLGADVLRPVPLPDPTPRSVCLYTPSVDPSGMGAHMVDLTAELVRTLDVTVMAWATEPGRRVLDRAAATGAHTVALPRPRDPAFADRIVDALRSRPVDVFHLHVGFGRENFDGARAARRAGVPVVVQTQHLPWLIGGHRPRVRFFRGLRGVDRLIAVSEAQRRGYERIGVPPELFTTVPNGVRPRGPGPGRAAARAALGLDTERPVVLTVGRLVGMKGHRHLLDAVPGLAARFPGLVTVLVGDGNLRDELARQAAALGVADAVLLAGHRTDARMLLDAADVFVLPSRQEAMPLALLEAMDARLPVVATRVFGSAEIVEDGVTGLLVPARDPAALEAALARLLADPGLRQRFAGAGHRRYRERFTSARMAEDTLAVYRRALVTTPSRQPAGAAWGRA